MTNNATRFYEFAKGVVTDEGYSDEISFVRDRKFENITSSQFFEQYVFVVMCWGIREQIASRFVDEYFKSFDVSIITCRFKDKKRAAISMAFDKYIQWFGELKAKETDEQRIAYLNTLPLIGNIMKFHLARNIGIDCIKPDRHLIRVAEFLKYKTPLEMCIDIQKEVNEPLGVIDVVIWRMCNLTDVWKQINFDM